MDALEAEIAKIGVVIAAFERLEHTVATVHSLLDAGLAAEQIVLVDGGSKTNTVTELERQLPGVNLISGLGNLWWTEGMNVGLRCILGRPYSAILLLNQDCLVKGDTLRAFILAAEQHPDFDVLVSVVLNRDEPEHVLDGGSRWQPHRKLPGVWVIQPVYPAHCRYSELPTEPYPVEIFTGRGVLIRRRVFEQVGLYDARHFPQRGSDDDLSLRVHKAGIRIRVIPDARCYTGARDCGADRRVGGFWKQLNWSLRHPVGGQGLTVHFWFALKHCPWYSIIPTYAYRLAVVTRLAWRQSQQA
jgi:GT2 family glycosyltransferase